MVARASNFGSILRAGKRKMCKFSDFKARAHTKYAYAIYTQLLRELADDVRERAALASDRKTKW